MVAYKNSVGNLKVLKKIKDGVQVIKLAHNVKVVEE